MHYSQNPQTKQKIDTSMQEMLKGFETQVAIDAGKPLLSKPDTLKYIKIMEEKKIESIVKLQTMARTMPMD